MNLEEKRSVLRKEGRCFRCANKSHTSKFCKAQWLKCEECGGRHMTTLCERRDRPEDKRLEKVASSTTSSVNVLNNNIENIYLQTARAIVLSNDGKNNISTRIIMDNGSQRTFVTEDLRRKMQLNWCGLQNIKILLFGQRKQNAISYDIVNIKIKNQYNNKMLNIKAVVVPNICDDFLPSANKACEALKAKGYNCADVITSDQKTLGGINILIGQDYYWKFNTDNCVSLEKDLTAVDTFFGWTVQGKENIQEQKSYSFNISEELPEEIDVTRFWSLESIGIASNMVENVVADQVNIQYIDGRYQVNLPRKNINAELHNNKNIALRRLRVLTSKLLNNHKMEQYHNQMKQLLFEGIIEEAPGACSDNGQ